MQLMVLLNEKIHGTDPRDSETRQRYEETPITITEPKTIKAVAVKSDRFSSLVSSKDYNMIVDAPILSVDPGIVSYGEIVTFTNDRNDIVYYYTVDGTTPSKENGFESNTFVINENTNLKVVGTYGTWEDSDVSSAEYKVKTDLSCSLPSGTYVGEQEVTLSSSSLNAKIYYTLDGEEPTQESTLYTEPITIESGAITELKVLAIAPNMEVTTINMQYNLYELSIEVPDTWVGNKVVPGVNETLEAVISPSVENLHYTWYIDGEEPTVKSSATGAKCLDKLYLGTNAVDLSEGDYVIKAKTVVDGVEFEATMDLEVSSDGIGEAGFNENLQCFGGLIFYDKGNYSDGWRYLEAAPADVRVIGNYGNPDFHSSVDTSEASYSTATKEYYFGFYMASGDSDIVLYVNGSEEYNEDDCTGKGYVGERNTELIVQSRGDVAYITQLPYVTRYYAAKLCDILEYKGLNQ